MPDASRPTAVRFGLAAAVSLAALYAVSFLWNPIVIVPLVLFACVAYGIRRGIQWSAYGGAIFLLALAIGGIAGSLRLTPSLMPPAAIAILLTMTALFAFLLIRAGRALPASPRHRTLWLVLAAAALLFTATMKPYVMPSGSMENTVLIGDQLYVRVAGPYTPARGDLVVFHYPPDPQQIYIKRIVAVGGDRLRFQNKTLILNGAAQSEPYARHASTFTDTFRDNFPAPANIQLAAWGRDLPTHIVDGDLRVPPGKYFVLGDNRDNSLDSRYWGFVDRAAIVGRPAFIYFSADRSTADLAAPQLSMPVLFTPGRIRWSRILHPVN